MLLKGIERLEECKVVPRDLILLIQLGTLRFDCYGDIVDSQCGF